MASRIRLGQNNPRDQIEAAVGAIEGNLLNLEDGTSDPTRVIKNIRVILQALKLVLPHVDGVEWNPEKPKEEDPL